MDFQVLIMRIILLFAMIFVGFVLRRKNMLNGVVSKGMSNLVLYAAQPALIFVSFLRPFNTRILSNAIGVFIFAFLVTAIPCFGSIFLFKKAPKNKQQVLRFATAFPNALFMGLPIVTGIFGDEAAIYASVYTIWFNIFVWSIGAMFYTGDKKYISAKNMFLNPATIAAIVGIISFVVKVEAYVPQVVYDGLGMLGNLVAPLSMIVIGIRLAEVEFKNILRDKYIYQFSFLRLLGTPIMAFVFFKLAALLGYTNEMVTFIVLILCSTPTASMCGMFAERFDADAVYASKCVSINTLFSLLTMPIAAILATL
ncbi:MAG: AEC family transporter [Clostridia bacterium]|nr:AEC family transporter [Clostridia bacterium]